MPTRLAQVLYICFVYSGTICRSIAGDVRNRSIEEPGKRSVLKFSDQICTVLYLVDTPEYSYILRE